jgi:hypothetical protein
MTQKIWFTIFMCFTLCKIKRQAQVLQALRFTPVFGHTGIQLKSSRYLLPEYQYMILWV